MICTAKNPMGMCETLNWRREVKELFKLVGWEHTEAVDMDWWK